jgi:hypothetical protein
MTTERAATLLAQYQRWLEEAGPDADEWHVQWYRREIEKLKAILAGG